MEDQIYEFPRLTQDAEKVTNIISFAVLLRQNSLVF
jgi:hypothetical protein